MEDRCVAIASLNETLKLVAPLMGAVPPSAAAAARTPEYAFFAVYDGHSGSGTSEALSQAFHFRLAAGLGLVKASHEHADPQLHLHGLSDTMDPLSADYSRVSAGSSVLSPRESFSASPGLSGDHLSAVEASVLVEAALELDLELQQEVRPGEPISGSTAIVVLVREALPPLSSGGRGRGRHVITVANVGDSRAVLCGPGGRVVDLSFDHKCSRPDEKARIEAAGGQVIRDRLHGVLAVSRAFGDADLAA